ncbi:NAD dependent epimerase/dehydratase family protein [Daejeonella rubra]|uniref:NAD dependent epimerase/dehydratase family protein n=1 Tax=Daejeonella rubra TaxID=990371 RepID=A0A1G9RN09_9SPHI|nr:NAD-dependent epimerase/dehydratase family protein [Daejeonella rubra]SDM24623.1 NAD dependent epimerase/dehydratase family protein [Daejeonella rubra]
MPYRVILVGASGLIGSNLLSELIRSEAISEILLVLRRSTGISNPKVKELILNFDELNTYSSEIQGDIIYSCLGTTKSETPDPALYRKIDLEYPLNLAKFGLQNGVSQFHIISSLGADAESSNSYLKLKGELEQELKKLNIPSLHIYQPSFLIGERKENRLADKIMKPISSLIDPLLIGPLKKYRSIKAADVAKVMLNQSIKDLKGTFIYPSIQIQELA